MVNFLILFFIILILDYFINYFLTNSFFGYKWRFFVAPGIIVHELSHAFACFITGAKITKISFFDKDGGSVEHHKSFIPVIGPILISTAPLVVGILIFYFLAKQINLEDYSNLQTIYLNFKLLFKSIDFTSWQNILIIYLLLSIAVTMTPSYQDLTNILIPILSLTLVFYLLAHYTSIDFTPLNLIFIKLAPILNIVVFILAGFLLVSFVLYFITKFVFKR
jgi:hypothetical protein